MTKPNILILHARGTNRDHEVALACELAGGSPEIVHINRLIAGECSLANYRMLILPGGFSYGDDLGAGKLWAVALSHRLGDELTAFVATGKPVLGICNGFQMLVKAGLLPGYGSDVDVSSRGNAQTVTLTRNDSARFECRWVYLQPNPSSPSIFTRGLVEPIYCPVAHGEGKFVTRDAQALADLEAQNLTSLRYVGPDGVPAGYPWNPNGSQAAIAGICNSQGNVLGLMPHPEDHVFAEQHPRFHRGERGLLGLSLFRNGVDYAAGL
jgi:phosphoribosylformylglycinamidine synthase subunit PurQ / glutaminase